MRRLQGPHERLLMRSLQPETLRRLQGPAPRQKGGTQRKQVATTQICKPHVDRSGDITTASILRARLRFVH
jgi:hypothetical protein